MKALLKIFKWLGFLFLIIMLVCVGYFLLLINSNPTIKYDYGEWNNGGVKHILSTFDHEKILIKTSFESPQERAPRLLIGDTSIIAEQNDLKGRFWQFYYEGLLPDTEYKLQVVPSKNEEISSPWNITSFPHPDSTAFDLRVLAYTCAGGVEENLFGKEIFISINARQELLKKGVSLQPDIVIANGDHIYWDQLTMENSKSKRFIKFLRDLKYGALDLSQSMLSSSNYDKFISLADAQIADLYGCYLREQSVYFVTDDHDLFENDEAHPNLVTLPPKPYMIDAARTTQKLYYPELFGPQIINLGILPSNNSLSTSFGSIEYGDLAAFSLYDCKRFSTIESASAGLIPLEIENWVVDQIISSSTSWQFQVPSSPFGWTAGKWSEWYPDVLNHTGELTTKKSKYLWRKGWWEQHQRILEAMSRSLRPSIIIQGDLHMAGYGQLTKSGNVSFQKNPVHLIAGPPLGSGTLAFPSSFRGTGSKVPLALEVSEEYPPLEKNGFSFLHVTKEKVKLDMYTWRPPELVEDIKDLKPSFNYEIK